VHFRRVASAQTIAVCTVKAPFHIRVQIAEPPQCGLDVRYEDSRNIDCQEFLLDPPFPLATQGSTMVF
jgi:hypothetical protein